MNGNGVPNENGERRKIIYERNIFILNANIFILNTVRFRVNNIKVKKVFLYLSILKYEGYVCVCKFPRFKFFNLSEIHKHAIKIK